MLIFQEIIDSIENLSTKDQDYLFELIRKRWIDNRQVETLTIVQEVGENLTQPAQIQAQTAQKNPDLNELNFDFEATPIWELAAHLSAKVPDEEWVKLPKDLAQNFDRYQHQKDNQ
jgi:hypothetical protein